MAISTEEAEDVPSGWEGLLSPGETILWQGRPEPRLDLHSLTGSELLMGGLQAAFIIFWITMAFSMGAPSFMLLFGLVIFGLSLNATIGHVLWDFYAQKGAYYTLTDRQAIIALTTRGKRELQSYPLAPPMAPALEDGEPGSVWFSTTLRSPSLFRMQGFGSSEKIERVGFRNIPDARRVYRLMLDQLTRRAEEATK